MLDRPETIKGDAYVICEVHGVVRTRLRPKRWRYREEARWMMVDGSSSDSISRCLTTETIQSTALALQSIDDIEGGDSLALGVLGVCDSITDDTFEEGL